MERKWVMRDVPPASTDLLLNAILASIANVPKEHRITREPRRLHIIFLQRS